MTTYAKAEWNIEDVRSYRELEDLAPWTEKQAETFLQTYEADIASAMGEQGWAVIGEMMNFDLQKREERCSREYDSLYLREVKE